MADSIFKQITENLERTVGDAHFFLYTEKSPLISQCNLEVGHESPLLKQNLKEGTLLHSLIPQDVHSGALDVEINKGKTATSVRVIERGDRLGFRKNDEVISNMLKEIGASARNALEQKLQDYQDRSGNSSLRFDVQWYEEESSGSSFSKSFHRSTELHTRVWVVISEQVSKPADKKKSGWWK